MFRDTITILTRRLVLAVFVLLLALVESWAVQPYQPVHPDPVLESWRWRTFPELHGLGLQCMAEDRDGDMWFGVKNGVMRYDGVPWTAYTPDDGLLGAPVITLLAARDGSVYAGTAMGISRFREGKWDRVFPPKGDPDSGQDLRWGVGSLMEGSDGGLWAGTLWGALRLSREGTTLYTTEKMGSALRMFASDLRFSIVPDEAASTRLWRPYEWNHRGGIGVNLVGEVIWMLAPGGSGEEAGLKVGDRILQMDKNPTKQQSRFGPVGTSMVLTVQRQGQLEPFEVRVTRKEVEGSFREFQVYDVYEDRDGVIWFGLSEGDIVRFDIRGARKGEATAWRLYTARDGLDIGRNPRIVQTRDGMMWTASRYLGEGVNRFDGTRWTHFNLRDLSGHVQHPSILETGDGTLWVGGAEGRLSAYRDGVWTVYKRPDVPIPTTPIRDLLEASDSALWVLGGGQEAVRLDYGTSRWTAYEGLRFQCETPDGAQWFLAQRDVVRYDGQTWSRYGAEDGLMDRPNGLIATREGVLWAAGGHDTTAATARFDRVGRRSGQSSGEGRWFLQTHPKLSGGIGGRRMYESSDGALWFGSWIQGVLRFDGKSWTHHTPQPSGGLYGIGQTADGALWFTGSSLRRFDGQNWTIVEEPEELALTISGVVYPGPGGDLWVGTRNYGAFHYNGQTWTRHDVRNGLAGNRISSILQTADGSVWAATDKGTSRFDGRIWTTPALPPDLLVGRGRIELRQSRDGAIWINHRGGVMRYLPDGVPPNTEITLSLEKVSQPGNTTLAWTGADPWRATPQDELQYAHRLNEGEWSPFSKKTSDVFLSLSSGDHTFEVKARDRDFNEDPTPARVVFSVVPPVWQEPWFIGLMVVLLGGIGFQTVRVVRRDRRLQEANTALSSGNRELFALNADLQQKTEDLETANQELQQDRAVERIRGEVQAMEQAADFEVVLSVLAEDLKAVGLSFDTCGIDVLDKPVDEPTMAYFEAHGFQYTTYTIDPEGAVTRELYQVGAPFPPVVRETLERFLAGEPWQGRSGQTAILEVPAATYGRLRMTASDRQDFTEEEVAALREFAVAIALGYTRYLDFQQLEAQNRLIQEQTERKSAFLASMSHELRTPMNAIKGFTNLVLRREKDLSDRNRENLEKVTQASDHLLAMINDLLDLSKIEAGRMDVNPEPFNPRALITTCCATVSPLLEEKPDVKLEYEVADGLERANTDQGRLRQMLINLLSNAIKFTHSGSVSVQAGQEDGQLVLSVSDTGQGIPEDEVLTIFDEYRQVKGSDREHKGTGLGLSITKQFAELLGGSISVQSEVGKGSTFTVRVPVVYQEA